MLVRLPVSSQRNDEKVYGWAGKFNFNLRLTQLLLKMEYDVTAPRGTYEVRAAAVPRPAPGHGLSFRAFACRDPTSWKTTPPPAGSRPAPGRNNASATSCASAARCSPNWATKRPPPPRSRSAWACPRPRCSPTSTASASCACG
ncbi:hypothetical protein CBM2587_A120217 [Cupriavidus taiwanensis]|uniref:Uncharacterized protein n=1 Tax=Cupriavidus taiwanensis TaxID=164546 RepID=A0A375BHX1_9BURK|nr:hypothetical protein CBM2587_A120217 [Cupriavidus taiwanensis]